VFPHGRCLLFAGTGAIVINDVAGGSVTHVEKRL